MTSIRRYSADDVSNLKNTPTRIRTYTALMRTVCTWESSLRRLYVVFASPHGLSEHRNTGNRRPSVFKIGSKRYRALSYTYSENQKTENRKQENNTKTMRKKKRKKKKEKKKKRKKCSERQFPGILCRMHELKRVIYTHGQ